MKSGSWRKYSVVVLKKKAKDQATNLPWMNLSLFSSRLGSAEEKPSE